MQLQAFPRNNPERMASAEAGGRLKEAGANLMEMLRSRQAAGGSAEADGEILRAIDQLAFQADLMALMDKLQVLSGGHVSPALDLQSPPVGALVPVRVRQAFRPDEEEAAN